MTEHNVTYSQSMIWETVHDDRGAESHTVEVSYDTVNPMEFTAHFGHTPTGQPILWTFYRNLFLSPGLYRQTMDVHVWDQLLGDKEMMMILLSSPEGKALMRVHKSELMEFLGKTQEFVPLDLEDQFLDIDRDIARLLEGSEN